MRKKQVAALALAAASVNGLQSGCAAPEESGSVDAMTVALFLPESKTARYESKDRPGFEQKLKELCPDCTLLYYNADQDAAKQQSQVEAAITQGADVLVIAPVDTASAASSVTRAKQSGIPVISYARLVTGADVDYFVSNNNEEVGVVQAESQLKALAEAGITRPGRADPRIPPGLGCEGLQDRCACGLRGRRR